MPTSPEDLFYLLFKRIPRTLMGGKAPLSPGETLYMARKNARETPRKTAPLDWAAAQDLLGNVAAGYGMKKSSPAHLEEALDAYQKCLEVVSVEDHPLDWAMAQYNRGSTLVELARLTDTPEKLTDAVEAFGQALRGYTRSERPVEWGMTQNALGSALRSLGRIHNNPALVEDAVCAFRLCLEERSPQTDPLGWATIQNNLANALSDLGEMETKSPAQKPETGKQASVLDRLSEALEAYILARRVYEEQNHPEFAALVEENIQITTRLIKAHQDGRHIRAAHKN
ncbi:MAG: hypothetical protein OEW12_01720 [Deltaproteobacteria bacterium]|nr:hypothetical protein [Deltaproteobacteria bacterium]